MLPLKCPLSASCSQSTNSNRQMVQRSEGWGAGQIGCYIVRNNWVNMLGPNPSLFCWWWAVAFTHWLLVSLSYGSSDPTTLHQMQMNAPRTLTALEVGVNRWVSTCWRGTGEAADLSHLPCPCVGFPVLFGGIFQSLDCQDSEDGTRDIFGRGSPPYCFLSLLTRDHI